VADKIDFVSALNAQADNLRVTVDAVSAALEGAELAPWRADETVAVVAMGASTHSGEALTAALAEEGIRAVNLTASDLELAAPGFQPADHYLLVSESGRSPEPIRAAERFREGRRIAITNDPAAPLSAAVDVVVPLGGWPDSRVYTSGFTGTLLAYAALVRHQLSDAQVTDPAQIPGVVESVLEDFGEYADRAAALLEKVQAVDFVARGVSRAAAAEGALVVREGARLHAAAYDTYQYIHGPMEPLAAGSALVVLGDGRELPMVDMVLDRGVKVVLLTQAGSADIPRPDHENLLVVPVPADLRGIARAVFETVFVQMVTVRHTGRAGIDIDEFIFEQPDTKLEEPAAQ
jgi:glucosamine--fructose-6-phosphate aminotransferase (isomerizing)